MTITAEPLTLGVGTQEQDRVSDTRGFSHKLLDPKEAWSLGCNPRLFGGADRDLLRGWGSGIYTHGCFVSYGWLSYRFDSHDM